MSAPPRERLYSEEEIASILRRSAKFQAESDATSTSGLTLEELKHIAAEVGIEPVHVEAASAELERGAKDGGESAASLFLPLTSHDSHIVHGEIRADQWEDVVAEVRALYGGFGSVGQVGNEVNWVRAKFPEPEIQVAVASRDGRTRVSSNSDHSNLLAFFFPGLFASSAVVAAVTLEGLMLSGGAVALTLGLWLTVYYLFARSIFSRMNRKERRRARKLSDRVEALLASTEESIDREGAGIMDNVALDEGIEEGPLRAEHRQRTRS